MAGALEGIRVLDFSHLLAGPFATQMLGDLGADVIKVERHGAGDLFRSLPPFFGERIGSQDSPNYVAWNRNKRSLSLDLTHPDAREAVLRIASRADVVVQNFRPGVMERLGCAYADLSAANPGLVYCSVSGYGSGGPYADRPGQDLLLQALSGLMSLTGTADAPPTPLGVSIADQLGAYHVVYSVLAALLARAAGCKGQAIEVDLLSCLLAHQSQEFTATLNLGRSFSRPQSGIAHPGMPAPFGVYRTLDSWIAIAMNPLDRLAQVLGEPQLAGRFDAQALYDRRDEAHAAIEACTTRFATEPLLDRMLAAGLWCSMVRDHASVADDPQVGWLGAFVTYEHPRLGPIRTVAPAVRMHGTPAAIRRHAPAVGEHTRELLREYGYTDAQVSEMLASGAAYEYRERDDG